MKLIPLFLIALILSSVSAFAQTTSVEELDLEIPIPSDTATMIFNAFKKSSPKVMKFSSSIKVLQFSVDSQGAKSAYVKFTLDATPDTLYCEAELLENKDRAWEIGGHGCEI